MREGAMRGFHILGIGRDELSNEEFQARMLEGARASGDMGEFTDD